MASQAKTNSLVPFGSTTQSPDTSCILTTESSNAKAMNQCPQCPARFGKACKLASHIKSVHENARPFQCTKCEDSFKRKDHLTRHMASKHAQSRNVYPCPMLDSKGCLMSFPNRDQLRKHVQRTHEKRIFCSKCFIANQNPEDEAPQFLSFQKKSQLRKHILVVHGEGFTCKDHCGRKFSNKKNLDSHLARIRASQNFKHSKMFLFDQESVNLSDIKQDQQKQEGAAESLKPDEQELSSTRIETCRQKSEPVLVGRKRLHQDLEQSPFGRELESRHEKGSPFSGGDNLPFFNMREHSLDQSPPILENFLQSPPQKHTLFYPSKEDEPIEGGQSAEEVVAPSNNFDWLICVRCGNFENSKEDFDEHIRNCR